MSQSEPKPIRAPIVEDSSVVGGIDNETGAATIKPKTPEGRADESMTATDPNERAKPNQKPPQRQ